MGEKQYIVFDRFEPENPQLFTDKDELTALLDAEVAEEGYQHRANYYTKIMEIEIEDFASVSGSWRDVTEDMYRQAQESGPSDGERNYRAIMTHYDNRRHQ